MLTTRLELKCFGGMISSGSELEFQPGFDRLRIFDRFQFSTC